MSSAKSSRSSLDTALAAGMLAAAAVMAQYAAAAEPLGRLFLTPEQRNRLEQRRQSNVAEVVNAPSAAQEADEPVASYLTLQGQIVRSSGKQTIFINGVPYSGREAPKGTEFASSTRLGEISIVPTEGGQPVPLKVGQSLDKNSLAIDDALLRAGTITIGKRAARPAAPARPAR